MKMEFVRFCILVAIWAFSLLGIAAFLSGCNTTYDGDGFVNTGRPAKPAKCVQIRPDYIKCSTI